MINVFMGAYVDVLRVVNAMIGVQKVLVEKKDSSFWVIEYCNEFNIDYEYVTDGLSIVSAIGGLDVGVAIVGSFGLILSEEVINKFSSVYNFHPGDVFRVRGRHPLPCTILNGTKSMSMSVHKIDSQKIDSGPLIFQYHMPIDYTISYKENEFRLISGLSFSAEYLCAQIKTGRVPLWHWNPECNTYYKRLSNETLDSIIHSERLCDI
jgi:methionyl-tRNA formyltransferase